MSDRTPPEPRDQQLRAGYEKHRHGDLDGAIRIYRQVLHAFPEATAAWHLCGLALHQAGAHEQAVELLTEAVRRVPGHAIYHNHLGAVLEGLGRLEEALRCFRRAAELKSDYLEARANCAAIEERLGLYEQALASIESARALGPDRHDLLRRHARLLAILSRQQAAIDEYFAATQRSPGDAELLHELGVLRLEANQADEATAALQSALALNPSHGVAAYNLGQALAKQDRIEEAANAFRLAAQLQPAKRTWALRPHLLCPPVFDSAAEIAEFHHTFERKLDDGTMELSAVSLEELLSSSLYPPYSMNFHGLRTRNYKEKFASMVRELIPKVRLISHTGKPRIGMVVTNRHQNLFLRCSGGIADLLDRQRFEVAIIAPSQCLTALRSRLRNDDTLYVMLPDRLEAAMATLAQAQCDVLYHWEVGSDDTNYLLPFAKAAPVQCTSWGTQVTSGIEEVDYYLSSRWIELPQADQDYTETLWRLESLPTFQRRIPKPPPTVKVDFGWSSQDRLYLFPQNLLKIHPAADALFLGILEADPQAKIVLKEMRYPAVGEQLRQRLGRHLGKLAARVVFVPWLTQTDYYRLVSVADVVLDAIHYSAGSSAYDMFSLEQPIVTLPTDLNVGRYTQACYRRIGFTELIAADHADYVRLAVAVANDDAYGRWLRSELRQRVDVLFEDRSSVTAHEHFFQSAIERGRANQV